jgi:putative transcriptional regulator
MAIAVKLDNLLHDRRMTLTELADRIGMALANLSILKTGKARAIRFSTLDAICQALSCQPGDILRFEPEQAEHEGTGDGGQTERKPVSAHAFTRPEAHTNPTKDDSNET